MYVVGSKVKQGRLANELLNVICNVFLVGFLTFYKVICTKRISIKRISIVPKECFFAEILHLASICRSLFEHLSWWNMKHNYMIENKKSYYNIHITVLLKICDIEKS